MNEIKNAIRTSLTVGVAQKISDHSHLLSYVKRFTSLNWGKTFVEDLSCDYEAHLRSANVPCFILNEATGEKVNAYLIII